MQSLPIFLKLAGRKVLVVGRGEAAAAKLRLLAKTQAKITLIGDPALAAVLPRGALDRAEDRAFRPDDVPGHALVYGATGCAAADAAIVAAAKDAGVPVNIVDRPDLCDFITPAVVDRDPVCVAIATNGASPVYGRRLRAQIEALMPSGIGRVVAAAGQFRQRLKTLVPDGAQRRRFWDSLFDSHQVTDLVALDGIGLFETFESLARDQARTATAGRVVLVGAGPGDPELLTLKAHRALQQADLIVYDRLVSEDVLDLARRDAERVYVGKARAAHSVPQGEINDLLIREARAGKMVVRLKSGDPFVFGRAGEELEDLQAAGIAVSVVPGVTAAAGAAAGALLPLTHRDHASAVTFVTGQLKRGAGQDWRGLFGPGRTLAIYMGLSTADDIAQGLIADGAAPGTPVAILEKASQPDERRIYGRLDALARLVAEEGVESPAVIVIGEVARLARDWPEDAFAPVYAAQSQIRPHPAAVSA